ncbi:SDR family NAD(P)-dependent oxidoreductase [Blautia sp. RD014234]|nr:SDR family NAD(P)-dependent oxidoreductase [Blautia parvula]
MVRPKRHQPTALLYQRQGHPCSCKQCRFRFKTVLCRYTPRGYRKMLYLQILCVTQLTHCVLKGMLQRHDGIIINISSDGAFAVMPHNVLYSSTKLYILNFTEGLHTELVGTGVHVQAVCPGFIDSHFHENAGMHMDKNKRDCLVSASRMILWRMP